MEWIQCPNLKMKHIENCLKFSLKDEIDQFYDFCERKMEDHINKLNMKLSSTNLIQSG